MVTGPRSAASPRPRAGGIRGVARSGLAIALVLTLLGATPRLRAAVPDPTSDKETRAAIDRVLDADRRGGGAELRLALLDLSPHDDPSVVDLVLRMLEHSDAAWRPTLRVVLGSLGTPASLARIARDGLGSRSELTRTQCLLALGDARPAGFDWITPAESALDDPYPEVRAAAVEALGKARARGRLERILDLTTDPSERVRKVVPEALARLVGERAVAALEPLSHDPRWRVRLGVVRAASIVKTRDAVELLVAMLDDESGRVREDILGALRRLTGRNLGLRGDAWRTFLAQAPADFLAQADAAVLDPSPPPTSSVRYYGLSTLSRRFVFVTDLSGSMETVDTRRYRESPSHETRLALTQAELSKLLSGLDPSHAFNLVTFSDRVASWQKKLVRAEPSMLKRAVSEVATYRADGATNVHAALLDVLEMAARSLDSNRDVDDPDTIFFLSDGAPSAGDVRDPRLLIDLVTERNRELELRFQCVILTHDTVPRDFLIDLAHSTGGSWVNPLE